MTSSWEQVKLGSVIELVYGKPLPAENRKQDGLYPVYGANGEIARTDLFYHDRESIIVGRKGSAGEINLTENRFWPLDVTYYVTFDQNKYDLFFLFYLLEVLDLTSMAKGVKPGINRNEVYDLDVRIPDLSEQQRIVAILDQAFEAIETAKANTENNLQNIRELFEIFHDKVFSNPENTWIEKPLKEVTSKIGSGATPLGGGPAYKEQGISLIRSLNVHDDGFREKGLALIDDEQASKLANVCVEPSDVLLNITGASITRCCIVPEEILPARVNQHVSIIRIRDRCLLPEFLHYALTSPSNKKKLLNIGEKNGSTRQALTKEIIENFPIRYPLLLSEQQSIIDKLNTINGEVKNLGRVFHEKESLLEELKRSILQKAFNGEL